jgi:hypothetical protein
MPLPLPSEDLSDFALTLGDTVDRAGVTIYRVRARVCRNGEWELVGFLDLLADEWWRLRATMQAHGGASR